MDFGVPPSKSAAPKIDCGLGHSCNFCPQESVCELDKPHHNKVLIEERLENIDQIIMVLGNKGGVGKSTLSANLAAGLAKRGFKVGMADADIHGPNQSRFFGFAGSHIRSTDTGLDTCNFAHEDIDHPLKVGSLAFMMQDDTTPIVWRDSYKHDFMHHLIGSFNWGPLDYLIIDMPPGTGNEIITLCDMLEGSNVSALLVSTPQAIAQMDSLKAGQYCKDRGMPIVGAVSNMAGIVCPHCEGDIHIYPDAGLDEALEQMDIKKLTEIPLSPELAQTSDNGVPVVVGMPQTLVAMAFSPIIDAVAAVGREDFNGAVARAASDLFDKNLEDDDLQGAINSLPDDLREQLGDQISSLMEQESSRLKDASEFGVKK